MPVSDSYEITASLFALRDGRDVKLSQGSRVRRGDKLFAIVDSSQPVYVYIINHDDVGQSYLLFPLPGFSQNNPLPARGRVRLPGISNGQQYYWDVTSAGGREHFYVYVTPRRLVEFEAGIVGPASGRAQQERHQFALVYGSDWRVARGRGAQFRLERTACSNRDRTCRRAATGRGERIG